MGQGRTGTDRHISLVQNSNEHIGFWQMNPAITVTLRATIIFAALSLAAPQFVSAQGMCDAGSDFVTNAITNSANSESADKLEQENSYLRKLLTLSPPERRKLQAQWPFLRNNTYNPAVNPGVQFPYVPDAVTGRIRAVCRPGAKILISGLRYSAFVAGELCDFGKSVILFNESVVCVIRDVRPEDLLGSTFH